jgi:putative ABC transport system permease protein
MMPLSLRLALRELRGGLAGFRVFLLCLALGVAAIAAVGLVRAGIERGLAEQGSALLGGDAEMQFTYRRAAPDELAWMAAHAARVSEMIEFRSLAVAGEDRALTQVKAVDDLYPLLGAATLAPRALAPGSLAEAFAARDGIPGAVMEQVLADRLGLKPGSLFRLGTQDFHLGAVLLREPDTATAGFALGPRTIVRTEDLANSGLLAQGTLFESHYRLLTPGADLAALKEDAKTAFGGKGMSWTDSRNAAPGVARFVDRMAAFLILVGLAGLAVGGVGVASAVRAYLEEKTKVIATLRVLGAEGGLIFASYLIQIGILAAAGILAGLALAAIGVLAAGPLIASALPFPVEFGVPARPLAEAALYGALSALLFTLWPLARAERLRAAALYRGGIGAWPSPGRMALILAVAAALVGAAVWLSGTWTLALGTLGGVAAALAVLGVLALGLRRLARRAARWPALRGRLALRAAVAALGAPRGETVAAILSLGLGLSVLATIGQIDANFRTAILRELPDRAPSFFVLDIQDDQMDPFQAMLAANPAVTKVDSAPMLRGLITKINGRPAREVVGDHWVVMGDRGITFSDAMPKGTVITEGAWWPAGYTGPPQISFADDEARAMGLKLGDRMVLNILGRDIEAEVTSFRKVDFSGAGMGFVTTVNPGAVAGAPHSSIATVHAAPEAEAAILKELSEAFPNITVIPVKEAITRAADALAAIGTATRWAAAAVLVTGLAVLIGAAAAGTRAREYEAAVLRVLGAGRGRILVSFALRAAMTGVLAGLVALGVGVAAAWAVCHFVMDVPYQIAPASALGIVAAGMLATLVAGLLYAIRPLSARPAGVLRSAE